MRIGAGGDVFPYQMALVDMDLAEGDFTAGRQLLENLISTGSSPEHVRAAKIALAQMYLSNEKFRSGREIGD